MAKSRQHITPKQKPAPAPAQPPAQPEKGSDEGNLDRLRETLAKGGVIGTILGTVVIGTGALAKDFATNAAYDKFKETLKKVFNGDHHPKFEMEDYQKAQSTISEIMLAVEHDLADGVDFNDPTAVAEFELSLECLSCWVGNLELRNPRMAREFLSSLLNDVMLIGLRFAVPSKTRSAEMLQLEAINTLASVFVMIAKCRTQEEQDLIAIRHKWIMPEESYHLHTVGGRLEQLMAPLVEHVQNTPPPAPIRRRGILPIR